MLWIIIIAVGVVVYFVVLNKKVSFKGEDGALDILKMRYVNGEIDEEIYNKMKNTLQGKQNKKT